MTNKRLKIAKIFIAINLIVTIVLSVVAFYGEYSIYYDGLSVNGVDDQKTFFELLKLRCLADEEDYTETSLKILNEGIHKYDNYCLVTSVEFGKPHPYGDEGIHNISLAVNTTTRVDGNKSIGVISVGGGQYAHEYKYYRVCNDGIVTTYLCDNDVWYVSKEAGEHVALDMNKIADELKETSYTSYPKRSLGETRAELYPQDYDFWRVNICSCREIGSLGCYNKTNETFLEYVQKATGSSYDEYTQIISDWLSSKKYEASVSFSIWEIGKVEVDIPDNIDSIAVEGDVYEIVMKTLAESVKALDVQ